MRKFEGNINGKIYTDEKEFDKALSQIEDTGDVYVSYKYVSIPDVNDEPKLESVDSDNESIKNYVSENEYVKNITNKKDAVLDAVIELGTQSAPLLSVFIADVKRDISSSPSAREEKKNIIFLPTT